MKNRKPLRPYEPRASRFMKTDVEIPGNNFRGMGALYQPPSSEKEPTVYPATIQIKRYAEGRARNAGIVTKIKGGMSGAPTGHNGLGLVPAAFRR